MIIYVFSFFGVPHFYTNPFRICSSLSPSFPRCESSRVLARITAHEGWGCLHCCSSRSTKGNPESVLRDVKHCVYTHLFAFIYIYIHLVYIYILSLYTHICAITLISFNSCQDCCNVKKQEKSNNTSCVDATARRRSKAQWNSSWQH